MDGVHVVGKKRRRAPRPPSPQALKLFRNTFATPLYMHANSKLTGGRPRLSDAYILANGSARSAATAAAKAFVSLHDEKEKYPVCAEHSS